MASLKSINPYNFETIATYEYISDEQLKAKLQKAHEFFLNYRKSSFEERAEKLNKVAQILRENTAAYAPLLTNEMGKPIKEAQAEIEKCAWACEYYAENAASFLNPRQEQTDADTSYVSYEPLGAVLAIMPWNFPLWQVFRFAAPALMAGNVCLLKHAANVQGCAQLMEDIFQKAGFAPEAFQNLPIDHQQVDWLLKQRNLRAVTLTGSVQAGRKVAERAGAQLKPTVLELGGSNAFIVMADADLDKAADLAVKARMINNAQSCIAAKRFLVMREIEEAFIQKIHERLANLKVGDPMDENVDIGPLARVDLAEELEKQVLQSITQGAKLICGGNRRNAFFDPTILSRVKPGMPAFDEELFGPVMSVISVKNMEEAIALNNQSDFGLGLSVITGKASAVEKYIPQFEDGAVFINEMVKSDPRLPFGGTKDSGYGRELSREGIRAFVNVKTVYINNKL